MSRSTGISSSGESTASPATVPAIASTSASKRQTFLDVVHKSNYACSSGDYPAAVKLYTRALKIHPNNHVLYSNRSAAHIKLGHFVKALQDALRARDLNPKWPKAYYRQGVALQCLGKHAEAIAAFSSGLAADPKSSQLLSGLVEAALKSPLKGKLVPTFEQLERMNLDKSVFVVISVIGQELLSSAYLMSSVVVLENGLKIGTGNLKLKGSVFSALSSAHWALNSIEKAINYMQQDLGVAKSLGDVPGECRAHGNLGTAYLAKGNFKAALTSHRYQLVLAMKSKDTHAAAAALTSLGHVYKGIGDYANAIASHQQCVQLMKQIGDSVQQAREIGNVGSVYLALGDFESAIDSHMEHLRIAKELGNTLEQGRAYANLGAAHHHRRNYDKAISFYHQVLQIATELNDKGLESKCYAGLGHSTRAGSDISTAKSWYEKQLQVALSTKDKAGEAQALSNLGIAYQLLGDRESALKLHQAHLHLVTSLSDRSGIGRAYGNIGNVYNTMGYYELAINYHKQELSISKEVNDRSSEGAAHGNLAVAYQALGQPDKALGHYHSHLNFSRALKDNAGEACALLNLGNCHSSMGDFRQAISFYENYLMVSQELSDVEGEAKACHFLGFAHYCLGNFREAVRYYDQDLTLAKDLGNQANISRAYCNLGLTHMALCNYDEALECQTNFLTVSHAMKKVESKFRALGNIGNLLMKMNREAEAVKVYQKQLLIAKSNEDRSLEANGYASLGIAHRYMKQYERAVSYHSQELAIRREIRDVEGECRAHGNIGAVNMSLGNYQSAIKSYEEMLICAKDLTNDLSMAQAYGNLGISNMNMGNYLEAIRFFEEQLKAFEKLSHTSPATLAEKAHALNNLGDSLSAIGKYKGSVDCHEKALYIFVKLQLRAEEENTEKSLGLGHRSLGNQQQALEHFERRLSLVSKTGDQSHALSDLGNQHVELKNYDEALRTFQSQLRICSERASKRGATSALANLGRCYEEMGQWQEALRFHQLELESAQESNSYVDKTKAYGRIGLVHESIGDYDQALLSYEEFLICASQTADSLAKATALSSVGRIQHLFGNNIQAIVYLKQGLQVIELLEAPEETAKLHHFLGLTLWRQEDLDSAETHLEKSIQILEKCRINSSRPGSDSALRLFDREIASYQALQRVLVLLGKTDEALIIAERARCIPNLSLGRNDSTLIRSVEALVERVNQLRSAVLYFSLVGTVLFSWLLIPGRGIVKFNECSLGEDESNRKDMDSLLDTYVEGTREALGIGTSSETVENEEIQSQLEELGEILNQGNDKTGFLRMVSRNHRFNASNYSISSLFSTTGSVKSLQPDSSRSKTHRDRGHRGAIWQGPSYLRNLHQLLIAPFEEELSLLDSTCFKELILVIEPSLLTVPFPLLRSSTSEDYLSEKFKLILSPSLFSTLVTSYLDRVPPNFLVVGNPMMSASLRDQCAWPDLPKATAEAVLVSQVIKTEPLVGPRATKSSILAQISSASLIHFATHISWKLSAVIVGGAAENEAVADTVLTAAEILKLNLNAKVVVLSCCHGAEEEQCSKTVANGDSIIRLTKALLASGAVAVLVSLWPTPDHVSKLFYRSFYSALLEGARVSHALSEAMGTLQQSKHFNHPANWAGYLLLGSDCRVTRNGVLPGQAIWELLKTPDISKDSLRVCLHLIEKSLQRIRNGQKNAMYTTQKSIENKVGNVSGWQEVLTCVGFRIEPESNGLPAAVFFPQVDPGERLVKCSACLQALLGLPPSPIRALAKLLATPEAGDQVSGILRQTIGEMATKDGDFDKIQLKVDVKLWGIVGCHELLAALGFDLIEVGENEVILGVGKNVTLRMVQLALQATLSLFEALRTDLNSCYNNITLSLDGVELKPEELEIPFEPTCADAFAHLVPEVRMGMGQGAFTSYVRSRGEPDGHTNLTGIEPKTRLNPAQVSHQPQLNFSLASIITRADSTASSDSTASGWEHAQFNTIRRRAPPPPIPRHPDLPMDPNGAKKVTWKLAEPNAGPVGDNSSITSDSLMASVYAERNLGLDIAPPLSKLLMSSRLNLSQVDLVPARTLESDVDIDPGNQSMDDTLSNFDQLSLAEDSTVECNSTKKIRIKARTRTKFTLPPVPLTRTSKTRVVPFASATPLQLFPAEESSSSNSSKGSPSDLYKRDEGDGRSLTDSQYGSYSPSMAITQTQTDQPGVYFTPNRSDAEGVVEPWRKESLQMNALITKDPPNPTASVTFSSSNQKSTEC